MLDLLERRLNDRIASVDRLITTRQDAVQKDVDRYLAISQLEAGKSQIGWAKWGVLIAVLSLVAAIVLGLPTLSTYMATQRSSETSSVNVPGSPGAAPSATVSTTPVLPESQP